MEEYKVITEITLKEIEELKKNGNKHMVKEDKLRIDKYYFENTTVKDFDEDIKSKLFYDYYQQSYKKKCVEHVSIEKSRLTNEQLIEIDFNKHDSLINNTDMIASKVHFVRKFNELLGLEHSCNTNIIIDKSVITGPVLKYIKDNFKDLCITFSAKIKKLDNCTALKLVQQIYNNWSGLCIKKNGTKQRVTEYITDGLNYYDCIKTYTYKPKEKNETVLFYPDEEDE